MLHNISLQPQTMLKQQLLQTLATIDGLTAEPSPVSGGMKGVVGRGVTIKDSSFCDNYCFGLWWDVSNYDIKVLQIKARNVGIARGTGAQWLLEQGARWISCTDLPATFKGPTAGIEMMPVSDTRSCNVFVWSFASHSKMLTSSTSSGPTRYSSFCSESSSLVAITCFMLDSSLKKAGSPPPSPNRFADISGDPE